MFAPPIDAPDTHVWLLLALQDQLLDLCCNVDNCPYNIYILLQVNAKTQGKAALHCAAVAGNIPVLKAILDFNPDLEIEVRM